MIAMKLADHILAHFPSAHDGRPPAGLTLVEDPDSVIADEEISVFSVHEDIASPYLPRRLSCVGSTNGGRTETPMPARW